MRFGGVISAFSILALLSGCAVNPVTGERELGLVSEAQERQLGAQNYSSMRQMEGGEYDLAKGLNEYVSGVTARLAQQASRPLDYEIVVLNNSVPNAWALPGGKMAINRGLLVEMGSEAELAAVLGHEIVHADARHGAQNMERGLLLQGAAAAIGMAASDSEYAPYVVGGANLGAQLISQRYSRGAELEADAYGIRYMQAVGYNPQAAVELQQTFVRLSEGRQQDWLSGLFASHPPSQARVEANQALVNELGAGGEWGRERYQRETAFLRQHQPAYEAYEAGRKALTEGKFRQALEKAEQAIAALSQEALFHGLRGDALSAQERPKEALRAYNRAIALNGDYFYFPLRRGLLYRQQGSLAAAETDLQASIKMLPTKAAYQALGAIEETRGNQQQAQRYYQMAGG
jgi:predicted Zn-dependent protease